MNKILLTVVVVACLVGSASAYWTEHSEIKTTSLELSGATPQETISNVERWVGSPDSFEYWTDNSQKYQEPHQFWNTRKGDCTEMAELARLMLKYNGIETERVHTTDYEGQLHDALFSAYGFVNPLNTPMYRVNGGGYW